MSFEAKEIQIIFYSNIDKFKNIKFDLNMLYNEIIEDGKIKELDEKGGKSVDKPGEKSGGKPGDKPGEKSEDKPGDKPEDIVTLNTLPYFTIDKKYPLDILIKKTYKQRIEFFFNLEKFKELAIYTDEKLELDNADVINYIVENNVMVMIELLFPTKFMAFNNFHTSYDHVFGNSSLKRMLVNPARPINYSYLKLSDGNIYTFTRLTWMNDILNHPMYKEFISQYSIFMTWHKREKKKIENQMNMSIDKIVDIVNRTILNILIGIKKSFNIYDVNSDFDDFVFDMTENNYNIVTTLVTFKNMLDKIKKNDMTFDNLIKNAGFKENNKNDKHFIDKAIKTINDNLKKEETNELNAEKIEKNITVSTIEENIYVKINNFIEKNFNVTKRNKPSVLNLTKFIEPIDETKKEKKGITLNKARNSPVPERVLPLIEKINKDLLLLYSNPLKTPIENYNNINLYINSTLSDVERKVSNINSEYISFMRNARSKYYGIWRTSLNPYLQTLIECSDEKTAHDFFNIFEKINEIYLLGKPQELDLNDQILMENIFNTSVNKINTNNQNWQYEIYVMADFIQGEVNDKNVNEIFCPYVGEYLGNMFDFLFRLKLYGKSEENDTFRWAVDRNRVSFSIKTMEFNNGTTKQELTQKPMINKPTTNKTQPIMNKNQPNMNNKQPIMNNKTPMNDSDLNNYFINNIIAGNKEFKNIISKMRDYSINIFDQTALNYIKTNNKKVYDTIIKMYKSNVVQNQKLFSDINKLIFSLKADVENKNNKLKTTVDEKKKIDINTEIINDNFYIIVLEKLKKIEEAKIKKYSVSGGNSRKSYNSKKKYQTRKNRRNVVFEF
jgi:hypothetical protein